jgi:hypothetical protein
MHQPRMASQRCDRTKNGLPRKRNAQATNAAIPTTSNDTEGCRAARPGIDTTIIQLATSSSELMRIQRHAIVVLIVGADMPSNA